MPSDNLSRNGRPYTAYSASYNTPQAATLPYRHPTEHYPVQGGLLFRAPLVVDQSGERQGRDFEALVGIIRQWNANRLDLFALSMPDQVSLVS